MKTLVLCVDRDDDIGVKTGIKGPLIGRDDNLAAALKLGLADPEDSDVNALLSAISTYDDLVKQGVDAEGATICGDVRVGSASDLVLTQQLDRVLEEVRPDRAFLVSDGAEDEAFAPILGSRIKVDHVRRVYVRQAAQLQSLYFQIGRQMKNPKIRRKLMIPLGLVLLLFGAIYLWSPDMAPAFVLILAGLYLILVSLPLTSVRDVYARIGQTYDGIRTTVISGDVSIFFTITALILVLLGIFNGADFARDPRGGYADQFLRFVVGALWWCGLAAVLFEVGKVATAYFKHGRVPKHVLAVAGSFVALGFLVLGTTQSLGLLFGAFEAAAAQPLIYLSIGLALFLVIATWASYRTPEGKAAEDSWRH